MAEWRTRGYVQDSDDEEDSQNSIPIDLTAPGEAVHIDDTGTIESGEAYDIKGYVGQHKSGGSEVEQGQKRHNITNAGEERSSAARLLVQHEKKNALSTAVGHYAHDTEKIMVDGYEDIDELQQDHYKVASAAQLEEELLNGAHDLEARPRLSSVPPNEVSFSSSLSSSILPEVFNSHHGTPSTPSTQKSACRDQTDDWESSMNGGPKALESNFQHSSMSAPKPLFVNQAHESRRTTRSLRHRNPIQIHPYALESEQYRQTLKARGVKPLRLAQMEAEAARAREQDSQNIDFSDEESQLVDHDTERPEPYSSSPIRPPRSPIAQSQDKGDIFVFGDDDLPDMRTLLSHSALKYVGNGHKRRKTAKAKSTTFRMPPALELNRKMSLPGDTASSALTDDDVLFGIPPSPPHSGGQTSLDTDRSALPTFRMPRRSSPAALPTPMTSSEPRPRHLLEIFEDEKSDDDPRRIRQTADADDSTDAELSPSEDETSHQFHRAQRKIRGVLPASWLKLDLESQKMKPKDSHMALPSVSPERNIPQRGIARTVVAAGSRRFGTPNRRHEIKVLSDGEGSESETDELPQTRTHQYQHHIIEDGEEGLLTGRWGEAAEDDQIDAMLPKATRAFHSRKSSKRQARNGDLRSRSRVTARRNSNKSSRNGAHQRKSMDQFDKGHKKIPRFRPPRLGILDAPLTKGSPQDSVPQFLKVASRTARSRRDKGRHSPSRKFVRLATRGDDNDANETLRNWRGGTIVPSTNDEISELSDRQPLHPLSANSPVPPRASDTRRIFQHPKPSTSRMTSVKPHIRSAKSRKLQTSLDHLIERRHANACDSTQQKAPSWLQRAIEKPKKRGQIVSSLRTIKDSRPAMLESTRKDVDRTDAQAMFHRDLARVNHFDDDSGLPGVVVRRFFEEDGMRPSNSAAPEAHSTVVDQDAMNVHATTKRAIPHKRRKRRPQHLNVPETWSREPSTPIVLDDYPDRAVDSSEGQKRDMLVGLGPFGTRYSDNFDVIPLPTGTCLSANTLLGSGAFAKGLKHATTANLESSRGYGFLKFNDRSLRWGPWNDTVSSELGEVLEAVSQSIQYTANQSLETMGVQTNEQVLLLLNTTLQYFSDHLSFLDPVDRVAYVLRFKGLLSGLMVELIDHNAVRKETNHQAPDNLQSNIQISSLTLILANQLHQISKHELVPSRLQAEVGSLVQKAAHHTLDLSLTKGLEPFGHCLSMLKNRNADYRIQDRCIEAFVVAQHVLGQDPDSKMGVWLTLLKAVPTKSSDGVFDITLAEQSWKQLFTLLPFLEIDAQGVVETGRRFKVSFDNWTFAKRLINPLLEASLSNPQGQPPSFNSYCRAVFGRCLHLINDWGWRRCESVIGILFDYFARNSLSHLRSEESKGSPLFLERLDKNPSLTPEPEDRGFHILLKIIGSGIRYMRKSYPEKKIRDIVWRLMPNHGRSHPKEEAIRQEHLDALRNHHDLLCTLYWASPPSCRPRLTVIRNLVNLETSHREACHINIRACFNLVKFQLSTDEPISNLEPFAEWHNHLLAQILQQHSLARTEAEDQVRSAQSVGGLTVSKELLETTIARNQRQVEAILSDALVCLKLAIEAAQNPKAASILLSMTLAKIFELFDASRTPANKQIIQALEVLSACASKCLGFRDENEESQDYGDWSAFVDDSSATPHQEDTTSSLTTFHDPLRHLLSNCFGADLVPDDALLLKVVDVWVIVAQVLVRSGLRSWTDFLGRFGNDSWSSLRDTEQTRKFSAYYLATLIEMDCKPYHDHKAFFLMSWVGSLVERESLLKFQHQFTSALLNTDSENSVLQNLPFWKDAANESYRITALDFSDRRLSLISSVLSNMRVRWESSVFAPSVNSNELRQEFKDLLKHLMTTMRRNYQELGHGSNARGAYVDFVHRVIEVLQQHTSTICPIDRFFTDNGAFPLPATDPTYVVAQLKNYGLRLQDARTPKQLAVFLQSVSERAAIDGQQPYLVGQLHAAMSNAFEDVESSTPSLRSFLVKNIVPAYIEMAFSTACGWILAMPYLEALQEIFRELLKDLDGANPGSVAAIASTIIGFLDSMRQSLENLINDFGESRSRDARTLRTMSTCYSAISALLPVLDYIVRLPGPTLFAVDNIEFFKNLAVYFAAELGNDSEVEMPNIDRNERTLTEASVSDIRRFATQELRDTLTRTWVCHDDQYYVIRTSTRREVVVDIGLYEEEKAQLLNVFREFIKVCRAMPALRDENDHILAMTEKKSLGIDGLFF
ncbi:MAG: hypothetical protein ALECFALPRED_009372 [Alectoria fallacina]|uniref:Uncharacterized protein n=1 Tax=Alectoria fallacina TaxID=1903189 RepID=A0A8H3J768_9LECA|nr:MAG: hypothetical protein ALECFALPRED_009372 [Alectoria fallacina]